MDVGEQAGRDPALTERQSTEDKLNSHANTTTVSRLPGVTGACGGLNGGSQKKCHVLIPGTWECDLIQGKGLCRCN